MPEKCRHTNLNGFDGAMTSKCADVISLNYAKAARVCCSWLLAVDRYDIFSWHCAAGDALEVIKDQNNGEDWCLLARKSRFSTCFDKAKPHTPSMTLTHYVTFMSHSDFCCTLDSLAGGASSVHAVRGLICTRGQGPRLYTRNGFAVCTSLFL